MLLIQCTDADHMSEIAEAAVLGQGALGRAHLGSHSITSKRSKGFGMIEIPARKIKGQNNLYPFLFFDKNKNLNVK